MFDPLTFKQQFPLFQQKDNLDLVYLDNAATTQKPRCVIDAIGHFYTHHNANANRASHRLAREATRTIEECRKKAADFLGAESTEEIVFTRGATESLNIIAHGIRYRLQKNDSVLLKHDEHHANLLPWQQAARATGAKLEFYEGDIGKILQRNPEGIKIIGISLASNAHGQICAFDVLKKIKRNFPHIILVGDATQYAAHRKIDMQQLPFDFLVCSAHKFFGASGVGLLYGREDQLQKLQPLITGGEMVSKVSPLSSEFQQGAARLEAGTSSLGAIAALSSCLDFWKTLDRKAMEAHEQKLLRLLHQKLLGLGKTFPQLTLLTQAENNIGIAALAARAPFSVADLGIYLDQHNIATRVGQHCAQLLWSEIYQNRHRESLRLSLAGYNTEEDINKAIDCIEQYCLLVRHTSSNINTENKTNPEQQSTAGFDFSILDWQQLLQTRNWQQRYKLLLKWGKQIPQQHDLRCDNNLVSGCESRIWLRHYENNGKYYFGVDSDSSISKALAALILCRCHKKSASHILQTDFDGFFSDLELQKYLSPSRNNGLHALLNRVVALASSD